jgi:hypothetical protein
MANRKQITWMEEDTVRLKELTKLTGITNDSILIRFAMKQLENTLSGNSKPIPEIPKSVTQDIYGEETINKTDDACDPDEDPSLFHKDYDIGFSLRTEEWHEYDEKTQSFREVVTKKVIAPKEAKYCLDGMWHDRNFNSIEKGLVIRDGNVFATDPRRKELREKAKENMSKVLDEDGMNPIMKEILETAPKPIIDPVHNGGVFSKLAQQPESWDGIDEVPEY